MKKTVAFLVGMTLCLALACCGGKLIKGAATISGAGITAYQSFDNVYEIIKDNIDAFSPKDVIRLRAAGETLQSVKAEVYALIVDRGSALEMVADLPDLIPLYEKAKVAYVMASTIIMPKIDEFEGVDRITLLAFQDTCMQFDTAITMALDDINAGDVERAQTVRNITGFIFLVGKIALPLIVL